MDLIIQEVYQQYDLKGELKSIAPVGNGLINKTFLITQLVDNQEKRYILQCINHSIFQNVEGLIQLSFQCYLQALLNQLLQVIGLLQ